MPDGSDGDPGRGRDADDRPFLTGPSTNPGVGRGLGDDQVLGVLIEAPIGERADRVDRERRLRSARDDLDPLPHGDAEGGDRVEAARAHRTAAGRHVLDANVGVERAGRLHQPRRGAGVQPMREIDHDREPDLGSHLFVGRRRRRRSVPAGSIVIVLEVRRLPREPAERFVGHAVQGTAELRGDGGRDRALDEGCAREAHLLATIRVEELERHLRGEDRAPEIHQHEDPVLGPHVLDRRDDPRRVGPDRVLVARPVQTAGGRDRQVLAPHLASERRDALGDLVAVRDQDESDHAAPILRPGTRASRSRSTRTRASPVRAPRARGRSTDADEGRDPGRGARPGGRASRGP